MKKILFVDLDRTLFDVDRFKRDFWQILGQKYGFDGLTASQLQFEDKVIDGNFKYGFERHLDALLPNISEEQAFTEARPHMLGKNFLFADALECLKWPSAEREVQVLTFGQNEYQGFKFSLCEPLQHLSLNIVHEPKRDFITRQYPGQHGWLIDDKPNQNLPDGFTEIWLRREQKAAPSAKNGIIVVHSLTQVTEIL